MSVPHIPPSGITISVPESVREVFLKACVDKGLTPEKAAALMVYSCCRALEMSPPDKDTDLLTDLEFARGIKNQTMDRLDKVVALAEKTLLDVNGIYQGLRNRTFGS